MIAIHKQKVRDRVDFIRDTMMGAQAQPKDIGTYVSELQREVGDKPVKAPAGDGQKFLAKFPKMVGHKPVTKKAAK